MYSVRKVNDKPNNPSLREFLVDTIAEIAKLPTNTQRGKDVTLCTGCNDCCAIGSTALCLENSSVYILGHDSAWHLF